MNNGLEMFNSKCIKLLSIRFILIVKLFLVREVFSHFLYQIISLKKSTSTKSPLNDALKLFKSFLLKKKKGNKKKGLFKHLD